MYRAGKCLLPQILKSRGMSQTDLAELAGIHKQTINAYVNNRQKMTFETAYNIALILNCDVTDLYKWVLSE